MSSKLASMSSRRFATFRFESTAAFLPLSRLPAVTTTATTYPTSGTARPCPPPKTSRPASDCPCSSPTPPIRCSRSRSTYTGGSVPPPPSTPPEICPFSSPSRRSETAPARLNGEASDRRRPRRGITRRRLTVGGGNRTNRDAESEVKCPTP